MPDPARHSAVVCVGHAALDAIVAVPRLPRPDERLPATDGVLAGGGPAATAAVALARLGVSVAFAGRVGDDPAGSFVREGLDREGVEVSLLDVVTGATPFTACLVGPDGDRVLLPSPGTLPAITLSEALRAALRRAAWLHVDHIGAAILPALRAAGLKVRVSVDGGNPIPGLALDGIDLYAPTVPALLEMTGSDDTETGLRAALDAGARLVVATDGARGSHATWVEGGVVRSVHVPAPPVAHLVSTLGAGDAFHGGLLAALLEHRPVEDALARANAVAAASTRALDGRSALPDRTALAALLAPEPVG